MTTTTIPEFWCAIDEMIGKVAFRLNDGRQVKSVGHLKTVIQEAYPFELKGKLIDITLWPVKIDKIDKDFKDEDYEALEMEADTYSKPALENNHSLLKVLKTVLGNDDSELMNLSTDRYGEVDLQGIQELFGKRICVLSLFSHTLDSTQKRKAQDELSISYPKEWLTSSRMLPDCEYYYYADPGPSNMEKGGLLPKILKGQYVALYGPRASGKTTRVYRAIQQLKEEHGLESIYITMQSICLTEVKTFWEGIEQAFRGNKNFDTLFPQAQTLTHSQDFVNWFSPRDYQVVVFLDEFDVLYHAGSEIRDQFLSALRVIRETDIMAKSVVAVGTFAILRVQMDGYDKSSFNIGQPIQNPNLSKMQVEKLFNEYASDIGATIEQDVIDDIMSRTNGHANLVCICGKAIDVQLLSKLRSNVITIKIWEEFVYSGLIERVKDYSTYRTLTTEMMKLEMKDIVAFLRSFFLYTPYPVEVDDQKKAETLVRLGVLRTNVKAGIYIMASPLLSSVIQQEVIPKFYPAFPSQPIPRFLDGTINLLRCIKVAVSIINQQTITLTTKHSHKFAPLNFGAFIDKSTLVPRESVYQQELVGILYNWFRQWTDYYVESQYCPRVTVDGNSTQKYCNITITNPGVSATIIELLATETYNEVDDHYKRVMEYTESQSRKIKVSEIWTVHFTCDIGYMQDPCWPSDEQLDKGLGAVVFWHNNEFTSVHMSARWKDTNHHLNQVDNEQILPLLSMINKC